MRCWTQGVARKGGGRSLAGAQGSTEEVDRQGFGLFLAREVVESREGRNVGGGGTCARRRDGEGGGRCLAQSSQR